MFKRFAMPVVAAAALLSHGALAADIGGPLRGGVVVAPEPMAHPVVDWSGFYVGAAVGGQMFRNQGFHSDRFAGIAPPTFQYDFSGTRFAYGLYAGAMAQFGHAVFGVEADLFGPVESITSIPYLAINTAFYQQRVRANLQGSLRARLGYVHGKTLFYVTGGLAIGSFKHCTVILASCVGDPAAGTADVIRYTATRTGYTLGFGMEHKFSHNWSLRAEYRYTSYGAITRIFGGLPPAHPAPVPVNVNASDIRNRLDTHLVTVGLTYTFAAPPAPVVPISVRN